MGKQVGGKLLWQKGKKSTLTLLKNLNPEDCSRTTIDFTIGRLHFPAGSVPIPFRSQVEQRVIQVDNCSGESHKKPGNGSRRLEVIICHQSDRFFMNPCIFYPTPKNQPRPPVQGTRGHSMLKPFCDHWVSAWESVPMGQGHTRVG